MLARLTRLLTRHWLLPARLVMVVLRHRLLGGSVLWCAIARAPRARPAKQAPCARCCGYCRAAPRTAPQDLPVCAYSSAAAPAGAVCLPAARLPFPRYIPPPLLCARARLSRGTVRATARRARRCARVCRAYSTTTPPPFPLPPPCHLPTYRHTHHPPFYYIGSHHLPQDPDIPHHGSLGW